MGRYKEHKKGKETKNQKRERKIKKNQGMKEQREEREKSGRPRILQRMPYGWSPMKLLKYYQKSHELARNSLLP